jgi:hypothetical protein
MSKSFQKAVPWGVVGLVGLVLMVEGTLATREPALASYAAWNSTYAATEAGGKALDSQVLCLGDSQVKFGLDPKVIERDSGLKAYNLAIAGAPPPASYFALRRALKAGARPSAIVIGHMTLSGSPRKQGEQLIGFNQGRECLDLAWACRDADYLARLTVERAFGSVRLRDPLRKALRAALAGNKAPGLGEGLARMPGWVANRGAEILPENALFTGKMEPDLAERVYSQPWTVYSLYAKYFHRLLDLAEAHRIKVVWVVAPIVPEAQTRREALNLDALHTRNLRAVQNRHPNVVILDARHAGYPASLFFDSCHLNGLGADRLSRAVATVLRDQAAGQVPDSRWIALTPDPLPSPPVATTTRPDGAATR